jgi:ATP-citrate lyase beta-subunit
MARVRSVEYQAKTILGDYLGTPYRGISYIDNSPSGPMPKRGVFIVKVDDGSKKRAKRGLVHLDVPHHKITLVIQRLNKKGHKRLLVEPYIPHRKEEERYLSLTRVREGVQLLFSNEGTIDIEENTKRELIEEIIPTGKRPKESLVKKMGLSGDFVDALFDFFDAEYLSFLEINPFVIRKGKVHVLDLAVLYDSAARFQAPHEWEPIEKVGKGKREDLKKMIEQLKEKTSASVSLDVLNENGSCFCLLSGGGASVMLADEFYHAGAVDMLGNFGEYSGNPSKDIIREYAGMVIELLLHSKAKRKCLLIAGGVANFTDIQVTFEGIIEAFEMHRKDLQKHNVKVFVRRGGPHQKEGNENMKKYLKEHGLYGYVSDAEDDLTDIVRKVLTYLHAG